MAEERVDALVLQARFDEQSLEASAQQQLAGIRRFTTQAQQLGQLPPLNIDTTKFKASLGSASQSVQDFFAGFTGAKVGDVIGLLQAINTELAATGKTGFLQALVPQLTTIRAEFGATSTEARELQSVIDALGSAPVALNVQQAVSASDTLINRLGLTTRAAVTAREALSQPIQLKILTSGEVGTLSGQLQSLRATEVAVEGATQRMNAAFAQSGREAVVASANSQAWARGMANLRAQTEGTSAAFVTSGAGASRLRGGLTALAVSASGTSPAIGSVVSGLLLLGGGSVAVLGAAAGIAIVAAAITLFEKGAKKAREEADALIKSLRSAQDARLPAMTQLAIQIENVDSAAAAAKERIAKLQAQSAAQGRGGGLIFGPDIAKETERLRELLEIRKSLIATPFQVGQQATRDLNLEAAAAGLSAIEARKLAVTLNDALTPAQKQEQVDLLILIDRRTRAAEAAKKQAEALEKMLIAQHALRVEQAGGGNLIAGAGGTAPVPTAIPLILQPALTREQQGTGEGDRIQAELEKQRHSAETLLNVLDGVDLALKDIGNANITGPRAQMEALANGIFEVTQGLDQIAGAARNVGLIGDEAARAIGSVLDLGDAIGNVIKTGATTGNVLGLIAGGINVIGSLFGKSAIDQEHDRILAENNQRLGELALSLDRSFQGAAGVQQAAGITAAVEAALVAGTRAAPAGLGVPEAIQRALAVAGLSLEQFAKIIRDQTGLEILDSKGHLIAATLVQADEAFKRVIRTIGTLGTSISDQEQTTRTQVALGQRPDLTGSSPGVSTLKQQRDLELNNLVLDPAVEARIRALDLETKAGQDAFLKFQQELERMIESGFFVAHPEANTGFQNVTELQNAVLKTAEAINALGDAAFSAIPSLIGVPDGFKQAALRFEAQLPGVGPNAPKPPTLRPQPFEPQVPGFSLTAKPGTPQTTGTSTTMSIGTITIIIQGAGKNGQELAVEIKNRLKGLSLADTGDPDMWGQT